MSGRSDRAASAQLHTATTQAGALLADPPWEFQVRSERGKGRSPERHYDVMTTEQIERLAVTPAGAILADPPWSYEIDRGIHAAVSEQYLTMPTEEIAAIPVAALAARDSCLFLWGTWPKLPDALRVIDAWGFKFKTVAFVWVKRNPSGRGIWSGCGYWTASNTEFCLLGTRGSPKRLNKDVKQVIVADRRQHSRKPDQIHGLIERLVPGPYVELFGRRRVPGWTVLGNEVDRFPPVVERAEQPELWADADGPADRELSAGPATGGRG